MVIATIHVRPPAAKKTLHAYIVLKDLEAREMQLDDVNVARLVERRTDWMVTCWWPNEPKCGLKRRTSLVRVFLGVQQKDAVFTASHDRSRS